MQDTMNILRIYDAVYLLVYMRIFIYVLYKALDNICFHLRCKRKKKKIKHPPITLIAVVIFKETYKLVQKKLSHVTENRKTIKANLNQFDRQSSIKIKSQWF